ncbi:unnamed protein product, partial [marine sediment metagenome]
QHEGESLVSTEERLTRVGSDVEEYITENIEKIIKARTVNSLRPPENPKKDEPIDIHGDILEL